jgi:hypothetical protein
MHLYSCKWFTVERSCGGASSPKFVDIDSDDKDPLLCSLYAPDIYYNLRVAEVFIPWILISYDDAFEAFESLRLVYLSA